MTGLQRLLSELDNEWGRLGVPLERTRRPGKSPDKTRSQLEPLVGAVHPDLITWFGWHDGSDPVWDASPWGGGLVTLDLAISHREMNLEISGPGPSDDGMPRWCASWLPLMVGPSMGDLVLDSSTGEVLTPYWDDQRWPNRVAPDLATAVKLWISVLQQGYYHWIDGSWHYDFASIPVDIRASGLVN